MRVSGRYPAGWLAHAGPEARRPGAPGCAAAATGGFGAPEPA